MSVSSKEARLGDWLWFLAWGLASSLWCTAAATRLGATFDEPVYIARGLEGWRTGSHQGLMQLGTMPLPVDLVTLPLYLWERWHGIVLDPVGGLPGLLPWARTGTLVFWWILLSYGRLAGRQLAGPWGGRLAVAMLACEPSLLAHASLATTDIAVTACLLALVYHFRTSREAGWPRRIAVPALWLAAAVLAKASGLVFGPLCLLVVEIEYLITKARNQTPAGCKERTVDEATSASGSFMKQPSPFTFRLPALLGAFRPFLRDGIKIGAVGLVLVFLYCGSDWRSEPSFVKWAHRLPNGQGSRAMVWLADHLCIFSNAGEGLMRQIKHNIRGHGTYLLGTVADRSIWYYFPVALTVKLSLPLLILPVLLCVVRPRALLNWACLATLVLLVFSLNFRVQIGIRLVLPLVVLAVIGLAAAAVVACRMLHERQSAWLAARTLPLALAAGVVWTVLAAIHVWPNGLCYVNELWGGTERGYLVLSDSNYDWGQGLKELSRWQRKHAEAPLDVWYFGSDPLLIRLPMRDVRFQNMSIDRPEDVEKCVHGHYLAASTSLLRGSLSTTMPAGSPQARAYWQTVGFLQGCKPVDRTATFLIYDFTGDVKNSSQVSR